MFLKLLSIFLMLGGIVIIFLGIYIPKREKRIEDNYKLDKYYRQRKLLDVAIGLSYFVIGLLLFLDILSGVLFNSIALVLAIIAKFIPQVIDSKINKIVKE